MRGSMMKGVIDQAKKDKEKKKKAIKVAENTVVSEQLVNITLGSNHFQQPTVSKYNSKKST